MDTAIQMQNVTLKKRHKTLLYNISLEAYRGEILGILGANGSGKTALIKVLTGQVKPDSGTISIAGENSDKHRSAMVHAGCILEENGFYPYLTGMQNLRMFAGLRPDVTSQQLTDIIYFTGLVRCINRKVRTYSNGMKKRLSIALALLHQPKVLILDEPAVGLDPGGIRNLREYLRGLAREQQTCILTTTNLLSEAELMCDRVIMLAGGRIVEDRPMHELIHTTGGTHTIYRFRVSNAEEAANAAKLVLDTEALISDPHSLELSLPNNDTDTMLARLTYQFVAWGLDVYTIYPIDNRTLEDAFLEITHSGGVQLD